MALVEKYHVVAAVRPVATGETIREGQIVALNDSGDVIAQGATASGETYGDRAYGIAGDTKSTTASSMPGIVSGWQNRVSDYFDETKASGKMTVYHSGGEFATDQFSVNVASSTPGAWLYSRNGILDTSDQDGQTVTTAGKFPVAMLTQADAAYPSGVPGTDLTIGDVALAGDTTSGTANVYIEFKLMI